VGGVHEGGLRWLRLGAGRGEEDEVMVLVDQPRLPQPAIQLLLRLITNNMIRTEAVAEIPLHFPGHRAGTAVGGVVLPHGGGGHIPGA
jgi:hypothetical protein